MHVGSGMNLGRRCRQQEEQAHGADGAESGWPAECRRGGQSDLADPDAAARSRQGLAGLIA
jgi:hypothetical protein